MAVDPIIARGAELPDLMRPLILAEEIKNRRETNKLYAVRQQMEQQRYAQEQQQAQQLQTQEAEKQQAIAVYHAAKAGNPMARNFALKKLSETTPGIFQGMDPDTAWAQIEPVMRQTLGIEMEQPKQQTLYSTEAGYLPADQAQGKMPYRAPPQPQQYAPAGYREVTVMEGDKPMVYMVNERNPSDRVLVGEAQAKGGAGGGVTVSPDGQLMVNPDPAKATEGERVSANYLGRMKAAEFLLGDYVPGVKDYAAARQVMQGGPISASVANTVLSPEGQRYYQAAADWVRAKLRKESGAVISPQEMEQEIKTYFPVPGDTAETVAQKRAARMQAQEGMQMMGGRAVVPDGDAQQSPSKRRVKFSDYQEPR